MTDTPTDRSPAEIEATVRKLEAQARLADAEAEAAAADADAKRANAATSWVVAKAAEREEAEELRKNEYHKTYHFVGPVGDASVRNCMYRLTQWHRSDPDCEMEIVFSSPGGSITDGMALFDFIRHMSSLGHKVTTGCLGQAASMAGILLQAGDVRWMGAESWVLIHRAAFGEMGKTFEVEDRVKWVKRIEKRIIDIFVYRSDGKLTAAKIRKNWERMDWWLTSEECLEMGVVDEVRGAVL